LCLGENLHSKQRQLLWERGHNNCSVLRCNKFFFWNYAEERGHNNCSVLRCNKFFFWNYADVMLKSLPDNLMPQLTDQITKEAAHGQRLETTRMKRQSRKHYTQLRQSAIIEISGTYYTVLN
jgi:hypothetical protein